MFKQSATMNPPMADNKEQIVQAVQILINASSQARLTAPEHDQVRQAAQLVANELGLSDGQDNPTIEMPDSTEE
mgnify:CR=1 FL=1|tara:strand:+ start:132 stop:353 length:222 start_codon:yes stop_codon:yes gene_type:complete